MTWEYIAGFFDGEGSLTNNGKGYRVTISQTNKEVLENILEYSGVGNIFKNKKRQVHWKESWVFYVAKQKDVYLFLKKISPFLIVKSKQINKFLPIIIKKVKEIDQKKLNRKKRIKKAKNLRKKGLTYRQIGKKMNVDFGYARRLILDIK